MPEGQRVLQGMGTVITIWVQHETPEVILEEAAQELRPLNSDLVPMTRRLS